VEEEIAVKAHPVEPQKEQGDVDGDREEA